MVILTGIYAVGFAVSRVPWWLAVATVCGLLNFIPVAGPVIALLIVLPVTWFIRQDAIPVLGALITYVVAQGLEGFYLTPKIMGRKLGLSPGVVFLLILIAGLVLGPLGALFAVPVAVVVAVLCGVATARMSNRKPRAAGPPLGANVAPVPRLPPTLSSAAIPATSDAGAQGADSYRPLS